LRGVQASHLPLVQGTIGVNINWVKRSNYSAYP